MQSRKLLKEPKHEIICSYSFLSSSKSLSKDGSPVAVSSSFCISSGPISYVFPQNSHRASIFPSVSRMSSTSALGSSRRARTSRSEEHLHWNSGSICYKGCIPKPSRTISQISRGVTPFKRRLVGRVSPPSFSTRCWLLSRHPQPSLGKLQVLGHKCMKFYWAFWNDRMVRAKTPMKLLYSHRKGHASIRR